MKERKGPSWFITFLCCLLAVPTVLTLMDGEGFELTRESLLALRPALIVGAALGVLHVLLRPILRLITAPLGCLTFGLFGMVIDVGLIYLAARFVEGFEVPGLLYAVLTALVINVICALAGGRH